MSFLQAFFDMVTSWLPLYRAYMCYFFAFGILISIVFIIRRVIDV